MRSKSSLFAVLAGVFMTPPLMAALYLAEQIAGLPFLPFDLFDWLARTLPGDVITRGIDVMVEAINRLNLGETSSTAKTLETLSALVLFFGLNALAGALVYAVLRDRPARAEGLTRYAPGAALGVIVAVPFVLISLNMALTDTPEAVIALWGAIAYAVWGAAIQWQRQRLAALEPAEAESAAGEGLPVSKTQLSRRAFLIRVGGTTATLTVIGAGIGRVLEYLDEQEYRELVEERRATSLPEGLPNADATVEPAPGTRPELTPLEDHYRIDINVRPPELDEASWQLNIHGLVDNPQEMTLDQVKNNYEAQDFYITLACISNPIGGDLVSTQRWTGVPLQDVLADAGVQEDATHIRITSADGFYETVNLAMINADRRIMLTYAWDGIPLLYKHGFPLRIYIPDRYGMKQPKWITDIEVMDHDEDGYWVERGWDRVARMKATSVVDVAAGDRTFARDGVTYVPVGGIARAGVRGISKVEVSVDSGEWVEAQLREPLSDKTWVIWRYDWPYDPGRHTFAVRCYEGDGTPQPTERSNPHPDGASGVHSLTRSL